MTEKSILNKLAEKGFTDTGQKYGYVHNILKSETEGVLYNPETDKIDFRYNLNEQGK